jgi:virulence factor Mce-like protein
MIRKLAYIVIGSLIVGALGLGIVTSVKWAYGSYDDVYYVSATLPRAGQQMNPGLDVRIRGVKIGEIAGIELVDRQAKLTLRIEKKYQIPEDAVAVISLKTPLGAKYVDMQFDATEEGPYLEDGDQVAEATIGAELEDALDDGVKLLDAIDPDDLGTIVSELADASQGRGDDVAAGITANSELSNLFASTIDPQLEALDDFQQIFGALEEVGTDLNDLAAAINEGAPVYASARAQESLSRALDAVVPFSNDFADLLILNRADWDRMMDKGDIVLGTAAARPSGIRDLVHGLYRYVYKLGGDIPAYFRLSDGSAGAGFSAFIGGNDQEEEENQICTAFPPDVREQIPACQGRS